MKAARVGQIWRFSLTEEVGLYRLDRLPGPGQVSCRLHCFFHKGKAESRVAYEGVRMLETSKNWEIIAEEPRPPQRDENLDWLLHCFFDVEQEQELVLRESIITLGERMRHAGTMYRAHCSPNKDPGLAALKTILQDAYDQVALGKGNERHGGQGFFEQQWADIAKSHGPGFLTGQAVKKMNESVGMDAEPRRTRERLGAIAYIAMSILHDQDKV